MASSSEPSATTSEGFGRTGAVEVEVGGRDVVVVEDEGFEEVLIREEDAGGSIGLRVVLSKPRSGKKEKEKANSIFAVENSSNSRTSTHRLNYLNPSLNRCRTCLIH